MNPFRKTVRLPVVFRSLDLEHHTKPQATVMCPVRNEPVTLGTCGHCDDFIRIEFDAESKPQLCCAPGPFHCHGAGAADEPRIIKDVLRVPLLTVSHDTPLVAMLPYLDLQRPWEIIPVLDGAARPVGIVSNEGLRRALSERGASTRTFEAVMRTHFARVYPWQNVSDAAVARGDAAYRGVVVVSADGTFLGLVTEYDLPNAA